MVDQAGVLDSRAANARADNYILKFVLFASGAVLRRNQHQRVDAQRASHDAGPRLGAPPRHRNLARDVPCSRHHLSLGRSALVADALPQRSVFGRVEPHRDRHRAPRGWRLRLLSRFERRSHAPVVDRAQSGGVRGPLGSVRINLSCRERKEALAGSSATATGRDRARPRTRPLT